jgi:adenosylcobinamide kinase / adenosylcobinamide-phosphate guanylyltransferase
MTESTSARSTLILGGARSGKSRLAERLALESGLPVTCFATATAEDEEMRQRIAIHRRQRPQGWDLVEEPIRLAEALIERATPDRCLLVDCLTLWLTNLLLDPSPDRLPVEREALLKALPALPGRVLLVSNETGLGVTPLGELSRRFCDEAGWLHQDLAACCDQVVLTVAGLPLYLKGSPRTI